jgi:hypothetical protein
MRWGTVVAVGIASALAAVLLRPAAAQWLPPDPVFTPFPRRTEAPTVPPWEPPVDPTATPRATPRPPSSPTPSPTSTDATPTPAPSSVPTSGPTPKPTYAPTLLFQYALRGDEGYAPNWTGPGLLYLTNGSPVYFDLTAPNGTTRRYLLIEATK